MNGEFAELQGFDFLRNPRHAISVRGSDSIKSILVHKDRQPVDEHGGFKMDSDSSWMWAAQKAVNNNLVLVP